MIADRTRLDPLIAAALASLLYLATRSRNITGDAAQFAIDVKRLGVVDMLEPHQLLTIAIAWLGYRLPNALGWDGSAIDALQVVNALAGGVCVGLAFATAHLLTGSRRISALVAAGFAVSGATWLLLTDAEFVTVPLAFWAAALLVALRAARPGGSTTSALIAGATTGVAILAWLPNGAAGLAFAAALALGRGASQERSAGQAGGDRGVGSNPNVGGRIVVRPDTVTSEG